MGFALVNSKRCKGDKLPCNGPSCLCRIFFFLFFLCCDWLAEHTVCRRRWRWWAPSVQARTCWRTWWVASECQRTSCAKSLSSRISSRRSSSWTRPSDCRSTMLWPTLLFRREFSGGRAVNRIECVRAKASLADFCSLLTRCLCSVYIPTEIQPADTN